jgi:hypothetical protein
VSPDVEVKYVAPDASASGTKVNGKIVMPDNQLDKAIEVLLAK